MPSTTAPRPHDDTAPSTVRLAVVEETFGLPVAVAQERYAQLTRRERQVAALMALDKPSEEIATELGISVRTLDIHRSNIKVKLHARTPVEVANLVNLVRVVELSQPVARLGIVINRSPGARPPRA